MNIADIKEELSLTYIKAIADHSGYSFENKTGTKADKYLKCDCVIDQVLNVEEYGSRKIEIQAKGCSTSSKSMFSFKEGYFNYNLEKDNYATLVRPNFYLVVVLFPDESIFQDWVTIKEANNSHTLDIKAKAYYIKLTKKIIAEPGKIKIPLTNVLDQISLKEIIEENLF
jgi:hypothetical protein